MGELEIWSDCLMGKNDILEDKKVLEIDVGDGHTATVELYT